MSSVGRFHLGVGLGYREVEDGAFGSGRRGAEAGEALEVIKLLWKGRKSIFSGSPPIKKSQDGVSAGFRS